MNLMLEKKHKIEAQGIPYVHNDFEKGVSQMVVFPYKTYEAWLQDYETAVFEIQPHLARKGGEPSMLDFLDDEPCKKAYMHHLDPKVLGQKFGETFNPLDTPFEDGLTPRKAFIK